MPDDLRVALDRFVEAAVGARIQLTYADLDMALPSLNYSSREIEAVLHYLVERDIELAGED